MPDTKDKKTEYIANDNKGLHHTPDLMSLIRKSHTAYTDLKLHHRNVFIDKNGLDGILVQVNDIARNAKDKAFLTEGLKFVHSIISENTEITTEQQYLKAKEKLRHVYTRLIRDDVFTESDRQFIFSLGYSWRMNNHQIFDIIGEKRARFDSYEEKQISEGQRNNLYRLASHILDVMRFMKTSHRKKTNWDRWKQRIRILTKKFYKGLKEAFNSARYVIEYAYMAPWDVLKWNFGKARRFRRKARVVEYRITKNFQKNFKKKKAEPTGPAAQAHTQTDSTLESANYQANLGSRPQTAALRRSIQMKLQSKAARG